MLYGEFDVLKCWLLCPVLAQFCANYEICELAKNCMQICEKLHSKAKFEKNCDFARKGEIYAKIGPTRSRFSSGTDILCKVNGCS